MKKIVFLFGLLMLMEVSVMAQKFAFVDTDYILKNIPSYKAAQEKLDQLSTEWQKEIEDKRASVEKLYSDFQAERVLMTEEMKKKKEDEIVLREKEVRDLQKQYFGTEGKMYEKRKELIQPIQEEVFKAVKEVAEKGAYAVLFDTSSDLSMLFTDPKYDKSDEVLEVLGYKN